jgi:hypothetical protein
MIIIFILNLKIIFLLCWHVPLFLIVLFVKYCEINFPPIIYSPIYSKNGSSWLVGRKSEINQKGFCQRVFQMYLVLFIQLIKVLKLYKLNKKVSKKI